VCNAVVALHRRYYGRGATRARAYQVNDELMIVELRDVYLTVERTLIERGQADTVRNTRLTFQQAMLSEFIDAVEGITGRKVTSYTGESVTAPEAVLEIFYLEPTDHAVGRITQERREDRGEAERPAAGIAKEHQ
jgi:uncharacterized protein YbcI